MTSRVLIATYFRHGGTLPLAAVLYYEWVHFTAPAPVKPATSWGRWMKKHHLLHHFQDDGRRFGVTNPLGDLLGGTL